MSKEISSGKKSNSFVEAVNSLTGLRAIQKAIEHLNPNLSKSVIGQFNAEYISGGSEKIKDLTEEITNAESKLANNIGRCEEIKTEKQNNADFISKYSNEIKQYEDAAKLQVSKELCEKEIRNYTEYKYNHLQSLFSDFSKNFNRFASLKMVRDALVTINNSNVKGKDIPNMHANTINYLLERGICICGTPLEKGSEHYKCMQALLEYLPPHSLGVAVGNFVQRTKERNQGEFNLLDSLKTSYEQIGEEESRIENKKEELAAISQKLSGDDMRERVRELHGMINVCKFNNTKLDREYFRLAQQQGELGQTIKNAENERSNLALKDKNNIKIEISRNYAQAIYEYLSNQYRNKEQSVKEKLQKYINENFKKFFNGDISLHIDPKYSIKVVVTGKVDTLETSTGQGIAVIFAFLAAVIRIAKENDENADTYPIVMDAPLSTLDKERIKSVCVTLPSIADQVIVFIKDTDGEVAEQNLDNRIGKKLYFNKIDQYTTEIR